MELRRDGKENDHPLEYRPALDYAMYQAGPNKLILECISKNHERFKQAQALLRRHTGLSFTSEDIETAFHQLSAKGVCFIGELKPQHWGGLAADFNDPEGNVWSLTGYLK